MSTPIDSPSGQRSVLLLVSLLLTWRVVTCLTVALSLDLLPSFFQVVAFVDNFHWPPGAEPELFRMWTTWDGEHYLYLAEHGYSPGHPSNRFFPLWPLLVRGVGWLIGGHMLAAALLLNTALTCAAGVLLHRVVSHHGPTGAADGALLLLFVFPGALFYVFPYSEALYLCLSLTAFYALDRSRWWLAAASVFMLVLARPVGVLVVLALAVHNLLLPRQQRRWWVLAAPICALLAYFGFMVLATGKATASLDAQQMVRSKPSVSRLFDVVGFVRALFGPVTTHAYLGSAFDRIWFLWFLGGCATLVRARRWVWLAYIAPLGLVSALSASLMSFTRYVAVLFPLFVVTAEWFAPAARRPWLVVLLATLLYVQLIFLLRHVNFIWVG